MSDLPPPLTPSDADLRDFEDYLRNSIGRQEQDKIATMNLVAVFPGHIPSAPAITKGSAMVDLLGARDQLDHAGLVALDPLPDDHLIAHPEENVCGPGDRLA